MNPKQIILFLGLVFVLAACGSQAAETPQVDDISIELAVQPDPPTAGETTLVIAVKELDGSPVSGAEVAVHGDMDHEGMIPVDSTGKEDRNGIYHVPFEWTMGGGWILDVTIALPDERGVATERFELAVGAISRDSIVNQNMESAEMDHSAMADMAPDVQIHYLPDQDPMMVGDTSVTVVVSTVDGVPIEDAQVEIHAKSSHEGMAPVEAIGEGVGHGRYVLPVTWTMAGDWEVVVTVTLADGQGVEKAFDQSVELPEDENMNMEDPDS